MDSVQLILATAVLGLAIFLVVFTLQGKKVTAGKVKSQYHKPTFLVVGANGAGKTSLFYKLQDGSQQVNTVSSLEPNYGKISIPFSNPAISKDFQFVDWPGHLKYSQLLRKLIIEDVTVKNLKGVIFVIDSSSQSLGQEGKVAAIAKFLYDLLSITEKTPMGVDYLFAINKQDLFDTKPVFKVKSLIEEEVSKLVQEELSAKGSARGGSGIDNDDEEEGFSKEESTKEFWKSLMGRSTAFKFERLEGNMEFIGGSALKNKLSNWQNWFDEKAMNYGGM
ncbi:hypothetical protein FT663_02743 [Candidozyma haemuli var. vulneris]|uniref:Signal recognition particle receptor subunit beta n=1 Tax=Candidozyma haemuli TaxID=45357 RepID=A0A2V1AMN5_9ASCO|nr:hypothetical protein CXQ85_001447 [[Candida] haemuloni]KAF3989649.1 hypothetical protein FT662_02728 [[Candida] haemuloni var. vulneris]KAF3991445.1 hypothetical protein FT663_02743 [[Candida] haemuloni var. vulneris]PVH19149.1 hypothetical protein CXQ85_001447 [[Candida] haemuloni]